ncbi:MAG: TIGR04222 domain-containing membrane protein, partial [Solirubrobacteraceae bacterium]
MFDAATATWGLTGPQFLWLYGTLLAVLWVAIGVSRWRALDSRAPAGDPRGLNLYEIALINGGRQLAITTAAATLHRAGVLASGFVGSTRLGEAELDPAAHPLERELMEVVRRDPECSTEALRRELADGDALTTMTERLTREGLLADGGRLAWFRWLWIPTALLLALGAVRALDGIGDGAPVGYLLLLMAATAAPLSLGMSQRWATTRGRELVASECESRRVLWRTPTAAESATAAALVGGAA